jgi:hypothetical protein
MTITTVQSGDWDDPNTWDGGVPTDADDARLAESTDLVIDSAAECNTFALEGGGATLLLQAGGSLTAGTSVSFGGFLVYFVMADFTITAPLVALGDTDTTISFSADLTVNGEVGISGEKTIGGGALIVNGHLNLGNDLNASHLIIGDAASLVVNGRLTIAPGCSLQITSDATDSFTLDSSSGDGGGGGILGG